MPHTFTGQETAADILQLVLDTFSGQLEKGERPDGAVIFYQEGITKNGK